MKKIILVALLAASCTAANAALPLVPTAVGTKLEYRTDDANGKTQVYTTTKVIDVVASGDTTRVIMESAVFDADRKPMMMPQADGSQTPAVTVTSALMVGDRMVVSAREMLDNMPGMPEGVEIRVNGTENSIPFEMTVGQKLSDYATDMTAVMREGGKSKDLFTMKVSGKDGEVLGKEKLTTPAGEFECWKVTQTETVKMMMGMMNTTVKSVTWYAPGVGAVRSEQYDGKGKLQAVQELVAMEGPGKR